MTDDTEKFDIMKLIGDVEKSTIDDFDPFFFVTSARALVETSPVPIRMSLEDQEIGDHPIIIKLEDSARKFENYKAIQIRVLRYFSAETMLLLCLSGHPAWPYIRVASMLRERELSEAVRNILNDEVPSAFELKNSAGSLNFSEWLCKIMFLGYFRPDDATYLGYETFFLDEVALLREKGALNAIKHGKPKNFRAGASLRVQKSGGDWQEINEPISGLSWVDWKDSVERVSIGFGTEELSQEDDMRALLQMAILMDAILNSRRRIYGLRFDEQIHTLDLSQGYSAVKRQYFKFDVSKRK
ncbi:MAG: hypothetical protein R3D60_09040 [Paracoccaceae bacterium]